MRKKLICANSTFASVSCKMRGYLVPCSNCEMDYWHAKLDGQKKGTVLSQNILGLPKQILMAHQFFFLFHPLKFFFLPKVPNDALRNSDMYN